MQFVTMEMASRRVTATPCVIKPNPLLLGIGSTMPAERVFSNN